MHSFVKFLEFLINLESLFCMGPVVVKCAGQSSPDCLNSTRKNLENNRNSLIFMNESFVE